MHRYRVLTRIPNKEHPNGTAIGTAIGPMNKIVVNTVAASSLAVHDGCLWLYGPRGDVLYVFAKSRWLSIALLDEE